MGSNRSASTGAIDKAFQTLEQIMAASEAVTTLFSQPGWDLLQQFVNDEADSELARLDRGGDLPSQAEYAKAHGRRGGLLYMANLADAIVARAEQRYREQKAKHEGSPEREPERTAA